MQSVPEDDAYYDGSARAAHEGATNCKGFHTRNELTESLPGLMIVLVGLPGVGKSFLSRKVEGFMKWQCRRTGSFNVGKYRRQAGDVAETGRADFFDAANTVATQARLQAAEDCLCDVLDFLRGEGEVAIFDATNTTEERRKLVLETVHASGQRLHVLFIEIICDDPDVLRLNYRNKVTHSPDFAGMDVDEAIRDLEARVKKYEDRYETIADDSCSYIKLYNMSSKVLANRIYGHSAKSLLPFLMGIHIGTRPIWLVRTAQVPSEHKQDADLNEEGQLFAGRLASFVQRRLTEFHSGSLPEEKAIRVLSSTVPSCVQTAMAILANTDLERQNFKQTSALNPLDRGRLGGSWWTDQCTDRPPWERLREMDQDFYAAWEADKLVTRFPGGESYHDVMARCESVLLEIEMSTRPVLCVSHITLLQVMLSYFQGSSLDDAWNVSFPEHAVVEITPTLGGSFIISTVNIDEEKPLVHHDGSPMGRRRSHVWRKGTPSRFS